MLVTPGILLLTISSTPDVIVSVLSTFCMFLVFRKADNQCV